MASTADRSGGRSCTTTQIPCDLIAQPRAEILSDHQIHVTAEQFAQADPHLSQRDQREDRIIRNIDEEIDVAVPPGGPAGHRSEQAQMQDAEPVQLLGMVVQHPNDLLAIDGADI